MRIKKRVVLPAYFVPDHMMMKVLTQRASPTRCAYFGIPFMLHWCMILRLLVFRIVANKL